MRIVSMLPSTTEIVCDLGLADQLCGVTVECNWPQGVRDGREVVVDTFGQSGRVSDLCRTHNLDSGSIVNGALAALSLS